MSQRAERFARSVMEELARLLPSVKDPRVVDAGLLTVTHVRVSDDLGVARVLVALHPYGELDGKQLATKRADLVKGLGNAAPWLRRELGRALRAKKVPELRFVYDETEERAGKVDAILREIAPAPASTAPTASTSSDEEE
jgi:ribosome-binding factor A